MRSLEPWAARRTTPGGLMGALALTLAAAFFAVPLVWAVLEAIGATTLHWLLNSALYSASGAAIAVAVCIPAGYGLATHDFPARRALLLVTIIVMLIPSSALVLPLFLEANAAHLLKSPLAVILPYGLFPFGVYLAYLYFNTTRIEILLQSARADGGNEWQLFRHIAVPLSAPICALIVFLNVLASWTNFFLPWVMYWSLDTTSRFPLSVGIALDLFNPQTSGFYTGQLQLHTAVPPSEIAILLLVSCAPVLIVLALAQRWIGSGQVRDVFR